MPDRIDARQDPNEPSRDPSALDRLVALEAALEESLRAARADADELVRRARRRARTRLDELSAELEREAATIRERTEARAERVVRRIEEQAARRTEAWRAAAENRGSELAAFVLREATRRQLESRTGDRSRP